MLFADTDFFLQSPECRVDKDCSDFCSIFDFDTPRYPENSSIDLENFQMRTWDSETPRDPRLDAEENSTAYSR